MKKTAVILICVFLLTASEGEAHYGEFLIDLGYEISESYEVKELILPNEFDNIYNDYNALCREAGFDLLPYRGKRCEMYTYEIYNHPFGLVRGNLIVCGGEIIGGDISSVRLDGFMQPLL